MKALKTFLIAYISLPANKVFSAGWIFWIFVAVSIVGFSDAAYLAAKYLQGVAPPCSVLSGCETVTLSVYAKIAGIPISVLGAVYYAALFVLALLSWETEKQIFFFIATRATVLGLIASAYFVYIQLFVLQAVCVYCMVSALVCAMLVMLSVASYAQGERKITKPDVDG